MLSHSLGSTHTLHAEVVHQEPDEVVSASPQQGEITRVPRDLEVQVPPQEVHRMLSMQDTIATCHAVEYATTLLASRQAMDTHA
jgi:hypothetical protein